MPAPATQPVPSSAGFLLFDSQLSPVFVNRAAVQILVYPQSAEAIKSLNHVLAQKIKSLFLSQDSSQTAFPSEVRSGRRSYACRAFRVDSAIGAQSNALVAVLLERNSPTAASLAQISERFHLTAREQKVLELLLGGLTSKEIAARMDISANTVKAFLRLIMIKMGVSTRSGIVGKALTTRS